LIAPEKLLAMRPKILILAGTNDARLLANRLVQDGYDVTSSFAGVTKDPILPEGKIRVGGFGGVEGMRRYLAEAKIDLLVDATHPFAAIISRHAAEACGKLWRLQRPQWVAQEGDIWITVVNIQTAVSALPFEARPLLTIGRKEMAAFVSRPDLSGVARMIEPLAEPLPSNWVQVLARPPFTVHDELSLMQNHNITHLVTKNAGGSETVAKLEAARQLQLPVIMIERPHKPDAETFESIDAIAVAIASR
jgi:precorrin-6A/cobalt-precorrin-6A reductase